MNIAMARYRAEHVLSDTISESYPLDWKEDVITHSLVMRLSKQFQSVSLSAPFWRDRPAEIQWEAYKLSGESEADYGDIGILVEHKHRDGRVTKGAAFIEAKARSIAGVSFPAVRSKQTRRLVNSSPHTFLLMYDYNPVVVLDSRFDPLSTAALAYPKWIDEASSLGFSNGPIMPLSLAAQIGRFDDSLYSFCHSFSFQLFWRFLALHDLDFRKKSIETVSGWAQSRRASRRIMVIQIAESEWRPNERSQINNNIYERLAAA